MSNRQPPGGNSFGDFPDLVPDLAPPPPRPAPAPVQAQAPLALPPIEEPAQTESPSAPPGPIDFGGSIDLDMPGKPNAAAPMAPPPAPMPSSPGMPKMGSDYKTSAQMTMDAIKAAGPMGAPQPSPSSPGMQLASGPMQADGAPADFGPQPGSTPLVTKEQVQEAARKAAAMGRVLGREVADKTKVVAEKTKDVAVAAAIRSVGGNQEKVIRIEDPSTWLKPMMGPLIALGLALFVSFVTVIAGLGAIRWLTIPLLLGAIVFGVVRWIRLQADQ